ncbi:glycosyltransferase [Actinopolymorpha pittospori]
MRISIVSDHASPLAPLGAPDAGGQNVHVSDLARALGRLGHQVTVHTRRDSPDPAERVDVADGVVVDHVPAGPPHPVGKDDFLPFMPDFGSHLAVQWATEPPDVVHAHFWLSGLAAMAAAAHRDIPVVQTFHALGTVKSRHQGPKDTSPPSRQTIEAALACEVDLVVASSSHEVVELRAMGMPTGRAVVVPSGVDGDAFGPEGPSAPRNERARILSVGRLVERKGLDTVIRALVGVPGAELLIAGGPPASGLAEDPEVQRLTAIARAHDVADRVRFLGGVARAEVPALYRSADVVVSVPWYEPFGMVPIEAAACGVPSIVSSVGGHLDTVVDEVTGLLVPPRDPAGLARRLRRLLRDADLRARLGAAGTHQARAYTWESLARTMQTHYQELRESVAHLVPRIAPSTA